MGSDTKGFIPLPKSKKDAFKIVYAMETAIQNLMKAHPKLLSSQKKRRRSKVIFVNYRGTFVSRMESGMGSGMLRTPMNTMQWSNCSPIQERNSVISNPAWYRASSSTTVRSVI